MNVYGFLGFRRLLIDKDINGNIGQFYQFILFYRIKKNVAV